MALGGVGGNKHRKSRRENSAEGSTSPKPLKSIMQAFWRRHSSASSKDKENTSTTRALSPSFAPVRKSSAPVTSCLEQAQRIARGQFEDNEEISSPPAPATSGFLPRIPEYAESYQMERLKAEVVRRQNSRSDRSEFNSAPPGVYWPDDEPPAVVATHVPVTSPVPRLPRIAPLSRPTSSVFFAPGTRSPVTSFCASPARTVSPTPFLHRPLPPTPVDRRGDKMARSINLGHQQHQKGPMWFAVPPKSPTGGTIEVVDTTVYSNVNIPVLRWV